MAPSATDRRAWLAYAAHAAAGIVWSAFFMRWARVTPEIVGPIKGDGGTEWR